MADYEVTKAYITRAEFTMLETKVTELTDNVESLRTISGDILGNMKSSNEQLIQALTGRVLEGSIPIHTHRQIIKGLFTAFFVILAAGVGVVKFLPMIMN